MWEKEEDARITTDATIKFAQALLAAAQDRITEDECRVHEASEPRSGETGANIPTLTSAKDPSSFKALLYLPSTSLSTFSGRKPRAFSFTFSACSFGRLRTLCRSPCGCGAAWSDSPVAAQRLRLEILQKSRAAREIPSRPCQHSILTTLDEMKRKEFEDAFASST